MHLVIDNEKMRLLEDWKTSDGNYSVAIGQNSSLELIKNLQKTNPRCNAHALFIYMCCNITAWNCIAIDIGAAAACLKVKQSLVRKYLKQLDAAGAFSSVDGDTYHFDSGLVFKPEFAPLQFLREHAA